MPNVGKVTTKKEREEKNSSLNVHLKPTIFAETEIELLWDDTDQTIEFLSSISKIPELKHILDSIHVKLPSEIVDFSLVDTEKVIAAESILLTPEYLEREVAPLLRVIANIQKIIDKINGNSNVVRITEITQKSPISVSLDGAASAIELIRDTVIPWRRDNAKILSELTIQHRQAEIEIKKAEILERRANAAKSRAEAEKINADAAKQNAEAEKMRLENEAKKLEFNQLKIKLCLDMINKIAPGLSETDKIDYVLQIMPQLDIMIFSKLEILSNE